MTVMSFVDVKEVNGKELEIEDDKQSVIVASHADFRDYVRIYLNNEETIVAVDGNELIKAIQNAMNR